VDGFIFLACPLDELSFVAGGAVVTFDISFNTDLAANSPPPGVIRFLHLEHSVTLTTSPPVM